MRHESPVWSADGTAIYYAAHSSTPTSYTDLGIFKNTYLTEKAHFQFRVEMYNAFNHRNFSLNIPTVLTVLDPGNALVTGYANVTSGSAFLNSHQFSGGNRIIQLGLKFIW